MSTTTTKAKNITNTQASDAANFNSETVRSWPFAQEESAPAPSPDPDQPNKDAIIEKLSAELTEAKESNERLVSYAKQLLVRIQDLETTIRVLAGYFAAPAPAPRQD